MNQSQIDLTNAEILIVDDIPANLNLLRQALETEGYNIIAAPSGEVLIGTGPGYLAEQGFEIQVGDAVSVDGFWENEEFKATEITLLADDSSIVLRDKWGRPMWAGAGRKAQNRQNDQNGL